jgi:histidyl-tRNA synthetase
MSLRNEVTRRIAGVYQAYGYLPLDTPIAERLTTLKGAGGDETDALIFTLQTPEGQKIGLRFDLTVPFARIVANYHPHRIKLPFRRYHVGPVFRADAPQPEQGRYRQFTQFDIDVAGSEDVSADAEIVAVMCDAMASLTLSPSSDPEEPGYFIRINSRKLVDAALAGLGLTERHVVHHVLRVLDKLDKLPEDEVLKELQTGRVDSSGAFVDGLGLEEGTATALLRFVKIRGWGRRDTLAQLEANLPNTSASAEAVNEMSLLLDHLDALGVEEHAVLLDASLARGLEYYTGIVYEGTLSGSGVGSVIGGGRYDGLVSRFSNERIPAVGASIGLDRLVAGLRTLNIPIVESGQAAVTLVLATDPALQIEASRVAGELRRSGIPTELYTGEAIGKLAKALRYANSRGFSVTVVVGPDELAGGYVSVKDLSRGKEERAQISARETYRAAGRVGQHQVNREDMPRAVMNIIKGVPSDE